MNNTSSKKSKYSFLTTLKISKYFGKVFNTFFSIPQTTNWSKCKPHLYHILNPFSFIFPYISIISANQKKANDFWLWADIKEMNFQEAF